MKESNIELKNIVKVKVLTDEPVVNRFLKNGWILLNIYTTCYDPEFFYKHQTVHYVLGLPYNRKLVKLVKGLKQISINPFGL